MRVLRSNFLFCLQDFKRSKRVLYFGILCITLVVKLEDGVSPSNGSIHCVRPSNGGLNLWARCQPLLRCRRFAADFGGVFKVWSGERSGSGDDLGAKTKKLFQCNPCSPARGQEPICLQHLRFPKFLLVSLIGSLKFNPKGDAILFVSGDFWVEKKKCSKS